MEKLELMHCWWNVKWCTHSGNSMEVAERIKHRITIWFSTSVLVYTLKNWIYTQCSWQYYLQEPKRWQQAWCSEANSQLHGTPHHQMPPEPWWGKIAVPLDLTSAPGGSTPKQSPSSEVVSPWWTSLPPLESNQTPSQEIEHFAKLVSSARSVSLKQQSLIIAHFGIWSGISFIRVCGYNVKRKYYCISVLLLPKAPKLVSY